MDLLLFLLFIFILLGKDPIEQYLEKDTMICQKGILALGIILHHLSQTIESGTYFQSFKTMGYLFTAVFFFLSGYGLAYQATNNQNYLNHFISKRIVKLVLPYSIITIIFYLYRTYIRLESLSFDKVIRMYQKGEPIVNYSWFILAIFFFYIFFFLCFRFIKHKFLSIIFIYASIYLYIILCQKLKFGNWWYRSCLSFGIGVTYGCYKEKISIFFQTYDWFLLPILCIGYWGIIHFSKLCSFLDINNPLQGYQRSLIASAIYSILFIQCGRYIHFQSRLLYFLGKISMEIFLLQKLPMFFFRSKFLYIESNFIFAIVVIISTIGISYLFSICYKKMFQVCNRFIKNSLCGSFRFKKTNEKDKSIQ